MTLPAAAASVKRRVAFRVDASARMGSGHLARCLALADALAASGAGIAFAIRTDSRAAREWIEGKGHALSALPEAARPLPPDADEYARWLGVPWREDASATAGSLRALAPDLLIVDHYALDARWETELRGAWPGRPPAIMAVDDIANRPHACDVLLDQNLHPDMAVRYRALVPENCRLLLGPRYALLRPEFAAAKASLPPRQGRLQRILVCFGGSDPGGETGKALAGILAARDDLEITVVAGALNPHFEALRAEYGGHANVKLHRHVDFMARLMAESDLAIGAGGATTWERCCLGLPALVSVLSDNQEAASRAVAAAGAQILVGLAAETTAGDYAAAIGALTEERLRSMSEAGMGLVDGEGCARVAKALAA